MTALPRRYEPGVHRHAYCEGRAEWVSGEVPWPALLISRLPGSGGWASSLGWRVARRDRVASLAPAGYYRRATRRRQGSNRSPGARQHMDDSMLSGRACERARAVVSHAAWAGHVRGRYRAIP